MGNVVTISQIFQGIGGLISWFLSWKRILRGLSPRSVRRSFLELKRDYGAFRAILLVFIFPDVRHGLDRIQREILDPPVDGALAAEKAMSLKESISDHCITLCGPACSVAQLSLLGLSLHNLILLHWVAAAALAFSLTTGTLSTFLAFVLHRHVDSLLEPSDLKKWFGRPADKRGTSAEVDRLVGEDSTRSLKHEQGGEATCGTNCPDREVRAKELTKRMRWKNVSFHAAFMMKIPAVLSVWSSGAFLIGIGVYLVSYWASNPEAPASGTVDASQGGGNFLVILVVYIVAMALGLLLVLVPSVLKYIQDAPIRQLDEVANPKNGRSKLDFEERFGDFEEYFEDSGERFKDPKECCRNFKQTFRCFNELYADFEDVFWESIGEPESSGTQADEHSNILLNDSAIISGNTTARENTQTRKSCQEETRQGNSIAKEATQSDVEEDEVGTGYASPEEGLGHSQGQFLSSIYGSHVEQQISELMKCRMQRMIGVQERNIARLRLMLLKEELKQKKTEAPVSASVCTPEGSSFPNQEY
ncbi:hypothetical protein J3458_016220 [Metarhizium acridum]|uniref:uncharacterized protein n=1 Tax=Metarhizium acridum TaxID=92637 RepID=UPI001C6B08B9|nr:hypothetical protein J3458_016220 [Metarhizium acridum]